MSDRPSVHSAEIIPIFQGRKPPVEKDGGGGHSGGMPPDLPERVAVLEQIAKDIREDMKGIRGDLKDIRGDIAVLNTKIAGIEGRLTNLPTTWVMITTILGSMIAVSGLAFTVAKLLTAG